MGKCVFCGNLSNNENNATLHKFPRDEALCKRWVKIIGREGWTPKASSFLCSDHFTKDSFVVHYNNNRKLIKPGIVPTILSKKVQSDQESDVFTEKNRRDNIQVVSTIFEKEAHKPQRNISIKKECKRNSEDVLTSSIIEELALENVPEASIFVECSVSPMKSKETPNRGKCLSSPSDSNKMTIVTAHEKVLHDHQYENTLQNIKKILGDLRRKLDSTMKKNKVLKQQVRRLKMKVHTLKDAKS